jgi:predicted amidohydrolase
MRTVPSRSIIWIAASFASALVQNNVDLQAAETERPSPEAITHETVRVASVQAKRRMVDWHIKDRTELLAAVDKNLSQLERIVREAGEQGCDALAFPEDTLGLLNWFGMNEQLGKDLLPEAVSRMLERLGGAAAKHRMYLVVCSDFVESDGATYNTAFLLGRDGEQIGRYHKTCPTWSECGARSRGRSLPVFPTPDLGTVGMLICYDLVFPETARCLALSGADIIFFPTMGGAAVGDDDIGLQALRVRAAENHVYLVVAFRGSGSMIISPRGKIIARAEGPDGLAIADIDPRGGRRGGDAMNIQDDMRARLFRERNPAAFRMLTDPNPPILQKVPISITQQAAGRIAARVLTVGEEQFKEAESLVRAGENDKAISAFERLLQEYQGSWIDRVARERIETLSTKRAKERP